MVWLCAAIGLLAALYMEHHGHAVTLTAPGHATVLTGTYPYRTGIIANEWVDRHTLQPVYNTGDAGFQAV